ncbi:MFS transporter [Roseovarius sp. SCSIO 43702]|uniref:MFS transporter n=1 Tax=Roseovarius sp. SCSIO 43702 TaxID=2823043 RepID=UPI001C730C8D|nr:MFS transporter [Roseovarius sp. SCSIO 43702]QYX56982.1 MFS transporter [Roseovarius sp. SCSIO 43702]
MRPLTFLRSNLPWLSAGFLLTFLSSFGQTFFISLFADGIRTDFGLSHGEWGLIYSLGTATSALVMVWAGGLTDRFRARGIGTFVLVLLAFACLFMALNPVWWLLPLVIFLLRFSGQGMLSHIAVVAMARWFTAARGKALSFATLGFASGEALLPLIFVSLMALFDWQNLWLLTAAIALLGIPALRLLLTTERTPQSITASSSSVGMLSRHWARLEAMRHWLFWLMIPALLGPSAFNTAFFFHQVHFAEIKHISHLQLVAYFPFYTGVSIIAMVLSGLALDRFGTPRLIPFMQLPMIAAFTIFAYASDGAALFLGFVFLGLTSGFNTTLPAAFWAEFYGTRFIGSIKAMAAAIMVLGSAIGPGITGYGIDHGIGLERQYLLVAVYFAFSTICMTIGVIRARPMLPAAP